MGVVEHGRLGFNYRLDETAAALGVAQLERIDELLAERARVAAAYGDRLRAVEGVELPCPDEGESGAAGSSTWSSSPRKPTATR